MPDLDNMRSTTIAFSTQWSVLGPFQIGTRGTESSVFLRFRNQHSLAPNGSVSWAIVNSAYPLEQPAKRAITFAFPDIDWKFQQAVFGWAALQYQAWARGEIKVRTKTRQTVALYTDKVLEFWVDDEHFFGGDYYGFRRSPVVLHLDPGTHQLDVRLIRDVRAMGGNYDKNGPSVDIDLELTILTRPLDAVSKILVSHCVDGILAGSLGSVSVQNTDTRAIHITQISSANSFYSTSLVSGSQIHLAPGQIRPIAFEIKVLDASASRLELLVSYTFHPSQDNEETLPPLALSQEVKRRSLYEPQKVTFMHPGGMVSYAMLRPPSREAQKLCSQATNSSLPILLQLHGAGLEAERQEVAHALDPVQDLCAWTLFPTGVTPWSGDDWHVWGFSDVEAAIKAIPSWIQSMHWRGLGANIEKWFVSGHSNGGQGSWYVATHRPDNVIALAPVSGYLSIQSYVPYGMWRTMDPRRQAVLQASLNSYRHELLADNLKGIPILQQHGSADDNVPVWHSRAMHESIEQAGGRSSYFELPGQRHWFDGIMTTEPMRNFYVANLPAPSGRFEPSLPVRRSQSEKFSLVVANPADTGSKNGITVLLLESPDQYGRIDVDLDGSRCVISTSNILSFRMQGDHRLTSIVIDGWQQDSSDGGNTTWSRNPEGRWAPSSLSRDEVEKRSGRQLGPMEAILRSQGNLEICDLPGTVPDIALQVSRNLHQYFGADTIISSNSKKVATGSGSVIEIFLAPPLPDPELLDVGSSSRYRHPRDDFLQLRRTDDGSHFRASLQLHDGRRRCYETPVESWGFGGIFLRPLENERLSLAICGTSKEALRFAARFVPMLTGVGQPDFILFDQRCTWKGADGVLAMGFFDHEWQATRSSFIS
ncbi:MAG: hypothetical protein Q9165_000144 [Trypethelium subeluteriae]